MNKCLEIRIVWFGETFQFYSMFTTTWPTALHYRSGNWDYHTYTHTHTHTSLYSVASAATSSITKFGEFSIFNSLFRVFFSSASLIKNDRCHRFIVVIVRRRYFLRSEKNTLTLFALFICSAGWIAYWMNRLFLNMFAITSLVVLTIKSYSNDMVKDRKESLFFPERRRYTFFRSNFF